MSIDNLYSSAIRQGIIRVKHQYVRDHHILLAPTRPHKGCFTLCIPTHWDVQEATGGLQEGSIRGKNPFMVYNVCESLNGKYRLSIHPNHGLSFFLASQEQLDKGLGFELEYVALKPKEIVTHDEFIEFYNNLKEAILNYCERPGIPLDDDMREQFEIHSNW